MTISQVLEHPWFQKFNKSKLPEIRRKSKDFFNGSTFKIYTTTDDETCGMLHMHNNSNGINLDNKVKAFAIKISNGDTSI
jgi:hypothetical protein